MSEDLERDTFESEKEIYHTQWTNIRQHWEHTFAGVRYLSTLVLLAIIPLKLLRVSEGGGVHLAIEPHVAVYLKVFVIVVIALMGLVTLLNQYNHYARSRQARKVVVRIEHCWNLYDENDNFIFQDSDTKYAYAKFAGGERRLTHAKVQFSYIVVITLTGIVFVLFA